MRNREFFNSHVALRVPVSTLHAMALIINGETIDDEIIEAEFPGLDQPPSAIRWIEPSTR